MTPRPSTLWYGIDRQRCDTINAPGALNLISQGQLRLDASLSFA
jgi:hypothetical protein